MQYQSIRVVRPAQFDSATAQTPGSQRLAAVHPGAGIDSPMWVVSSPLNLRPARQSTITASNTRSRTCSAALPMKPGGRVLAVDFGTSPTQRGGIVAHFHRHAHISLAGIVPLLS